MMCLQSFGSEDKTLGMLWEQGCDTQAPALVGRRRGVAVWVDQAAPGIQVSAPTAACLVYLLSFY